MGGGGAPSRGDFHLHTKGRKNWGISTSFRRRRRHENFLSTFLYILEKFLNKKAIKSGFWGELCRNITKIFAKILFWKKKYFYARTKIRKHFYTGNLTPFPKNLSDKQLSFLESVKQPSFKVNKNF